MGWFAKSDFVGTLILPSSFVFISYAKYNTIQMQRVWLAALNIRCINEKKKTNKQTKKQNKTKQNKNKNKKNLLLQHNEKKPLFL